MKIYKIPIEIIELDDTSFHLFVKGSVNGASCDFIIDTGASKSVFAMNLIGDMLDTTPMMQPDVQSTGISAESMESLHGLIQTFTLGDLIITEMEVVLIDLSSIDQLYKKVCSKSIWGLIGSDFLLKYLARIDYGKRILTLRVLQHS